MILKKVSIILPNYNSSEFLKKTLNSILNQTYKNWELLIVDDNSNNETIKLLKKIKNKKIKIYFLKKNKGAGFCRNFAINKSKSHYLAFIDSDDIWNKNKLKFQISFMEKNKFNFTYTYYKTNNFKTKKINKTIIPEKFNFNTFVKNTSIATSSMMVTRPIIHNIKFINSKVCEDFFFKCQLLKKNLNAYCLKKYLMTYSIRGNSLQSKKLRNLYWMYRINKNYNKFNFFMNIKSLFFISINSIKKYGFK